MSTCNPPQIQNFEMDAPKAICDIYTCPICRNLMAAPIYMCVMGHSFCDRCYLQISKCPTCRDVIGSLRNYAMERIQKNFVFPCSNADEGCTFKGSTEEMKQHEPYCSFSITRCPLKPNDDCRWTGYRKDMANHATGCHPSNAFTTSIATLRCPRSITGNCCMLYFNSYGKHFLGLWHYDIKSQCMNWSVLYLGPPTEAETYHFTLVIEDQSDPDGSFIYTGRCHSAANCDVNREEIHVNIDAFHLLSLMRNESFYYTVSIYDHDVPKETIKVDRQSVPRNYMQSLPVSPKWRPFTASRHRLSEE
ncbi:E3 ubiquitin-protein ligase SIAH2-like [Photinus pyralis]|uniref:E3 ubiquitin-protein ligase SIAH2-like n=1 Tax=Photinus pyralis TaxID=7054 RepID=UPI0012672F74|nr:E3 ubiquitin-protein ligase SIAH2-like [Photinus pyralis]